MVSLILECGDPYWSDIVEWHRAKKHKLKHPKPKKRLTGTIEYEDGSLLRVVDPDPGSDEWNIITSSPFMRDLVEGWHNGRPIVSEHQIGWDGRWPVFDNWNPTRDELEACKDIWERCECTVYIPEYDYSCDISFKVYERGDR